MRLPHYAVKVGRTTGVFPTWEECEKQVKGHKGAIFKRFNNHQDAINFVEGITLENEIEVFEQKGSVIPENDPYKDIPY